ncbi:Endo/exonuclease/phosphatase domain-containing protein [Mycena indigotica]|uniref:Endo/exonuclease/phosphatase domain-containing protein n=1 Tax=Mycena indigotica TaxID=2126181 RepID=A0A8H6SX25_9AGAR|nr:Endo/exonuclease/phosphatase domain-containing protein [Mycena indigotica]KAF7306996.1 Endo/exonuclease/phosphatase domain-containing protein [Mycena indigotica]
MSKRFQLTPEQLALSQERKAKKQKLAHTETPPTVDPKLILPRPWIHLHSSEPPKAQHQPSPDRLRVLTWNILAQTLVRRELFPTSDCLKASQRQPMLHAEILAQDAEIICLQEVDTLEKLLPALEPCYTTHYAAGPGKKHGCLIAFKKDRYDKHVEKLVHYDDEVVRDGETEQARRGSSFKTRNIASLLAVKHKSKPGQGVVVGTSHLFWHPRYTYERARQAGIFLREITKFQSEHDLEDWPCVVAGDFNFSPDDPAYSLLVGDPLSVEQRERLETSRVVHASIDPNVQSAAAPLVKEDEDQAVDPDRVITNARRAKPSDGLLTDDELVALFSTSKTFRSAYDEGLRQHRLSSSSIPTFGDRTKLDASKKGFYEPEYTSYTVFWKTVLDYIFFLPGRLPTVVTGILAPHKVEDLGAGLPLKTICGSDHVSLSADLDEGQPR